MTTVIEKTARRIKKRSLKEISEERVLIEQYKINDEALKDLFQIIVEELHRIGEKAASSDFSNIISIFLEPDPDMGLIITG